MKWELKLLIEFNKVYIMKKERNKYKFMKKILLFLLLILSFQIIAKEEEVRIWYQNGKITEVGITIEEIVDLRNIKIDENNKVEIEMKNYKFFVDKSDLIQEHNNNKENIRNKVPKLSNLGSKIDKKQLKDIDFRETLFSLIKNKKVIIYDKMKKKNLQEVAICSGYSEETNQKRQDFSGVIYEKLIYSVDLKDKIIIPDWRFHYSGVVNILHYENVTFKRNGREILNGIDWHINKDENWALLGLNGSGKSTLLGMIPAYIFPTSGEVRVFGHKFGNYSWKKIKNRVGFVSSTLNNFSSTLNGEKLEDVVISGKFNSIGIYDEVVDKDREKADKIIEDFRISYIKNNRFGTLSQGEQRRTLLARAFMNEPDLLILDEPCSGLDVTSREYFLKVLEENSKNDNAIPFIYVTHQIEEIMPSVTHVALLHDGKILAKGLKKDILTGKLLSQMFGLDVKIVWEKERPWLIVR